MFRQWAAEKLILRTGKMWLLGVGGKAGVGQQRGTRNLFGDISQFCILTVAVVFQIPGSVKIHQTDTGDCLKMVSE